MRAAHQGSSSPAGWTAEARFLRAAPAVHRPLGLFWQVPSSHLSFPEGQSTARAPVPRTRSLRIIKRKRRTTLPRSASDLLAGIISTREEAPAFLFDHLIDRFQQRSWKVEFERPSRREVEDRF